MFSSLKKMNRRKQRIRFKLKKNIYDKMRLTVYRSNNHFYAQIIDDKQHVTIASASSLELGTHENGKVTSNNVIAQRVGESIAKKALEIGCNKIVFDRSGYLYHGRVKTFAEAARANGLVF